MSKPKLQRAIREWSRDERPREKLADRGAESLSNIELVTILIGSGGIGRSAMEISRDILDLANNNLRELSKISYDKLLSISGIGPVKAITLIAAFEIFKRVLTENSVELSQIKSSKYAATIMSPLLKDLNREECWIMYMNKANRLISKERISVGGVSATVVDVKIIIKNALEKLASSIILIHNHPSGNANPGESDRVQTKNLKEAARLFDITLIDHIIIAGDNYYSFADDGII